MNKNEYLELLESSLKDYNIKDYEAIVEKYRKRFILASDAGMTEQEAIKMMGSVESVCKKYMVEEDNTSYYEYFEFKLDVALAEDIVFKRSNKNGITVNVDEKLIDKLNINRLDHKLIINEKFGKGLFRKRSGNILIEIGQNIKFSKFDISTVSSDVFICDIDATKFSVHNVSGDYEIERIVCENLNLATVSGDFEINRIIAKEIKVSTVSGDADIKYIEADTAIFDTISGDINIRGNVKLKRGSSITGSINYKEMN